MRGTEIKNPSAGLLLTPPEGKDIPAITEAVTCSHAELNPWMGWCHPQYNEGDAEIWVESVPRLWRERSAYVFLIKRLADHTILGSCGFSQLNWMHRFANLGYWVRTDETGNGYATEASRMVARWGFHQLGLVRLEIIIEKGNDASCRVAEKTGARREGLFRNRLIIMNKVADAHGYALIPEDLGESTPQMKNP